MPDRYGWRYVRRERPTLKQPGTGQSKGVEQMRRLRKRVLAAALSGSIVALGALAGCGGGGGEEGVVKEKGERKKEKVGSAVAGLPPCRLRSLTWRGQRPSPSARGMRGSER